MGLINWFKRNKKLEQPEEVSGGFINAAEHNIYFLKGRYI